jgi:hypothetical protein
MVRIFVSLGTNSIKGSAVATTVHTQGTTRMVQVHKCTVPPFSQEIA